MRRHVLRITNKRLRWKKYIFTFGIIIIILSLFRLQQAKRYEFKHRDINQKCIIPDPDPFDRSIKRLLDWHPPPLSCDSEPNLLYIDHAGNLVFNQSILNPKLTEEVQCYYSIVEMLNDYAVKFNDPVLFHPPVYIKSDIFSAKCVNKENKLIYENLHHKIDYRSLIQSKPLQTETEDQLSVLMFGLDSVSRLAALRFLPKTMDYLQSSLGAYVLKGYNKIGESTYDNVMPILTGNIDDFSNIKDNMYMDDFPFIWKKYRNIGYVPAYAEDWPEQNFFNTYYKGFKHQPVDHYMRPFFLAMRHLEPVPYYIGLALTYLEGKRLKFKQRSSLCYGNRPTHGLVVDFHKQFVQTYKNKVKFSFSFIGQLAHDNSILLQLADLELLNFFKSLKDDGYIDNTIIILFGDHGNRYDAIRDTVIGRIEDRMPLMSIVIPKHIKTKYPDVHMNLLQNTQRLTSNYDIHATLVDILEAKYEKGKESPKKHFGISLFQTIADDRTCADASIPEEYCACYSAFEVNVTESVIKSIGSFIISAINNIVVEGNGKCSKLSLKAILSAEQISSSLIRDTKRERIEQTFYVLNSLSNPEFDVSKRYRVSIKTTPGGAMFESTVKYNEHDQSIKIIGHIRRINKYGSQSICVNNRYLKQFCFCN